MPICRAIEIRCFKKLPVTHLTAPDHACSIFFCFSYFIFSLSDIMDLRHQSSAMCIIMLGEKTHTPVLCNEHREPHTSHYPSNKNTNQQTTHTSHYPRIRDNLPKTESGTICPIIFGKLSFTFGKLSFGKLSFGKLSRIRFLLPRSV